jgi:hypothetical protein
VRILINIITLFGLIASTGCQGKSINPGMPSQITFGSTTPLPTASENPTSNPTPTLSTSFPIIPIPMYIPENVQELTILNEDPIHPPFNPDLEKIMKQVKEDLAQRLTIDPEQIELVEVASVTWQDGSLGCGIPGTEYLQVFIPGYKILLTADRQVYTYHTDTTNQIISCVEKLPIRSRPTP